MKVTVITISDRASRGEYKDLSGPKIEEILVATYPKATITRTIISDEPEEILHSLTKWAPLSDIIITTGGTGISPRDNTPEITAEFCTKEVPGVAEALRAASLKETPMAMLSRGYAGIYGNCLIMNFPGSVKAVTLCTEVVIPILSHADSMFRGKGH